MTIQALARRALSHAALAAAGLAMLGGAALAQALEPLALVSGDKRHPFQVEVARNDAERAQGLMYRRELAADRGMLFDFEKVQPIGMWMKNTYISLDMIFIRPDGTIARIAANTEPLSTRTVESGEPVLAVLEVAGGTAARLGVKAGDRVEHPLFRKR